MPGIHPSDLPESVAGDQVTDCCASWRDRRATVGEVDSLIAPGRED